MYRPDILCINCRAKSGKVSYIEVLGGYIGNGYLFRDPTNDFE